MALKDQVTEKLKAAMKEKNEARLDALRSLRAEILDFEKSGANRDMTPDEEIKIVNRLVKKRREGIEQYETAGRTEQAESERKQLETLQEFLPKQLSEEEVEKEIRRLASDVGAEGKKDFGKLMPAAMKALKGKADGAVVKSVVERVLGES